MCFTPHLHYLPYYFAYCQVTQKTHCCRCAEFAIQSTSRLTRNTQRQPALLLLMVSLVTAKSQSWRNKHTFDMQSVMKLDKELRGCIAVRTLALNDFDTFKGGMLFQ